MIKNYNNVIINAVSSDVHIAISNDPNPLLSIDNFYSFIEKIMISILYLLYWISHFYSILYDMLL